MKKLLITLLLSLSIISSSSYGEELNSLFGINLYENAEKYFSSNFIDSNKIDRVETLSGFYALNITNKVKNKSPYANYYDITIDGNNIVHDIYGSSELIDLEKCQDVREKLTSDLEAKNQIEFGYFEEPYLEFKTYSNYYYSNEDNYLSIQCKEIYGESYALLQIYITSPVLGDAIDDYYESGL
jgi:hypothetical protein